MNTFKKCIIHHCKVFLLPIKKIEIKQCHGGITKKKREKKKRMREGATPFSFSVYTYASKQHRFLVENYKVIQTSTTAFIESFHMRHVSYTSGEFRYRTCLIYSKDELPQMLQVLMSKQVGCTPQQSIHELSYIHNSQCIPCMSITTPCINIDYKAFPLPNDQLR